MGLFKLVNFGIFNIVNFIVLLGYFLWNIFNRFKLLFLCSIKDLRGFDKRGI